MAIENVLQELTAAVKELAVALKAQPSTTINVEAHRTAKVEAPKPAPTPTAQPTTTANPVVTAKAEPAEASPSEVSYDQVKAAITKLVSVKGNDAAAAVLASFGVKRGPALAPGQYAAVVAACEAA